jgi:hypothetical protein
VHIFQDEYDSCKYDMSPVPCYVQCVNIPYNCIQTSCFCRIMEFALVTFMLMGPPPAYEKDTSTSTALDEIRSASFASACSPITVSCRINVNLYINSFIHSILTAFFQFWTRRMCTVHRLRDGEVSLLICLQLLHMPKQLWVKC